MDLGKILEDFLDDAKTDRAERERAATRNEIFYSGEHAEAESFGGGSYLWNRSNLRPLSYNHISTVVDAFSARLLRNNPFPTSYPISGSPEDQVASQITNAIISQRVRAEDYDDLVHRVVRQGTIHGCAGFKVVYNPEKDLVEWLPLTLFDLYLDPYAETEAEAGWVIFERHIAKPEAQRLLEAAGIKAEPEEENFRKTGSGRSQAGCPLRELWLLPGVHPEFPQGLFAQFVGTEPVQAQDFPYFLTNAETGQEEPFLPLALFSPRATRGSAYGSTPTDNAIEPQKRLNKLEATLANLEELTGNVKLKTSARLAKVWNQNNQFLPMTTAEMQYTSWLRPPEIPPILLTNRAYYAEQIHRLFGLSELASGQTAGKSHQSAKQVAFLSELDYQKSAGASKSLRSMVLRAWKLTLALMQRFYLTERLATFANASDLQVNHWKGSMLMGADIMLEPTEGIEKYSAQKGLEDIQRMQQGLDAPQRVSETSETGLEETQIESVNRTLVDAEIEAALMGGTPQPQAERSLALRYLDRIIPLLASEGTPPERLAMVQALRQAYLQKGAKKAPEAQPA